MTVVTLFLQLDDDSSASSLASCCYKSTTSQLSVNVSSWLSTQTTVAEFCQHVMEELIPGDWLFPIYSFFGSTRLLLTYGVLGLVPTLLYHSHHRCDDSNYNNDNDNEAVVVSVCMSIIGMQNRHRHCNRNDNEPSNMRLEQSICSANQSLHSLLEAVKKSQRYSSMNFGSTNDNEDNNYNDTIGSQNTIQVAIRPMTTIVQWMEQPSSLKAINTTTADTTTSNHNNNIGQDRSMKCINVAEYNGNHHQQQCQDNRQSVLVLSSSLSALNHPQLHTPSLSSSSIKNHNMEISIPTPIHQASSAFSSTTTTTSNMTTRMIHSTKPMPSGASVRFTKEELIILAKAFLEEDEPEDPQK